MNIFFFYLMQWLIINQNLACISDGLWCKKSYGYYENKYNKGTFGLKWELFTKII